MRAERINKIAKIAKAKTYLEIGVFHGETFFEFDVDFKLAVDPIFRFDWKAKSNRKTKFYGKSSDHFFRGAPCFQYDLIYIDGLHTYEQTLRDFMNSIHFSYEKTFWILDDTFPNDNFAVLPNQDRRYRLRRQLNNGDWSWTEDVCRVVYFLRSAMNFYSYLTYKGHAKL